MPVSKYHGACLCTTSPSLGSKPRGRVATMNRAAEALWGMFCADALAMPSHWFYGGIGQVPTVESKTTSFPPHNQRRVDSDSFFPLTMSSAADSEDENYLYT